MIMTKMKKLFPLLLCVCISALMLALSGCGGGGGDDSSSTMTTTTGTVTAGSANDQTVASPAAATITLPANTTITDENNAALSGSLDTSVGYSTSTDDLRPAAKTLPNGCTLAAFLDISLKESSSNTTAKYFSKALQVKLTVTPAAAAGETVVLYTFNTTTNVWEISDTLNVAQDGTVSFSLRHLSIWGVFKTATPKPGKPKGLSLTPGNGQITASWSLPEVGNPTSYNLYYSTTAGVTPAGTGVTKVTVANAATSTVVTGLTNGTTYYFVVTAVNANGEGGPSSEASAAPDASLQPPDSPNGVKLTAGSGQVKVDWNTKLTATSYNIYYAADASTTTAALIASGTKVNVAALSADPQSLTQSYAITGLTAGTTYSFVVTSQNAAGESGGQNSPKTAIPL
jgi:hypothetical protein